MRARATASFISTLLVSTALTGVAVGPAEAVQVPVSFTAAALPTYQTNGVAWAVASAQNKVFVGGTFSAVRPPGSPAGTNQTPRANFVTLDAATGTPTSCAPSFLLPSRPTLASVRALNVSPDGRTLYIGGAFSSAGGVSAPYLAALDIASCKVFPAFVPRPSSYVRTIVTTGSTVYFGGDFSTVHGVSRGFVAAVGVVRQTGAGVLTAFHPVFDKPVTAIAIRPDGSAVAVGGRFDHVNGSFSHALAVVSPGLGSTYRAFGNFVMSKSVVKGIAVDSTAFYTANEGTGAGSFDGRIAVYWGSYAQRWRDLCLGATQTLLVYRSVLYSGSHAHNCSPMGEFPEGARHFLLAETLTGGRLLSWFPNLNDGIGEGIGSRAMTIASVGAKDYLYVTGEFTRVNGALQQGITRFGPGPDTTAPYTPTIAASSPSAGRAFVVWRTSLDTDDSTLTYRVYRDTSSTPIFTTTATSWFWSRPYTSFTDTGLASGSTHTYRVSASDGVNTRTSAAATVRVR